MQQLTGLDASFVYSESARRRTTSIMIYDQSTAPKGEVTFKGILEYLQERVHLARSRRKLVRVPPRPRPSVLDRGRRVRPRVPRAAHRLAEAGDWRQFCIQAARCMLARSISHGRSGRCTSIEGSTGSRVPEGAASGWCSRCITPQSTGWRRDDHRDPRADADDRARRPR
jgi:hypothetical protein